MSRKPAARQRAIVGGFTLLEMLVTLVVVGFVVALLSQGLWQTAQIEKRLADASLRDSSELLRLQWLRDVLEGVQPTRANGPEALQGEATSLRGFSNNVPGFPATTAQRFELRLSSRAGSTEQVVELRSPSDGASGSSLELLRWSGAPGRLRYLSRDGAWHDQWPPAQGMEELVPSLVLLESGHTHARTLLVAPRASSSALFLRRQEQERL